MDSRTNQEAEAQVRRDIERLEADLRELKTRQPNSAGLRYVVSDEPGSYDWSGTLPSSGGGGAGEGTKVLTVTADAGTAENNIGALIGELYVGTSSNRYTYGDYLADLDATGLGFQLDIIRMPVSIIHPKRQQWSVAISGDDTTTCFVKFYVASLDEVSISIVEVN